MLRMLIQAFFTTGLWNQHLFCRWLTWKLAFYSLTVLWFGMEERSHKSHCLSESPQFTEGYFNIIMHKVSSFLWFSITVKACFKCSHPVFLSRLIEVGSRMKHFPMSLIVPGNILSPSVLKIENKILPFSFEKT